MKLSARRHWITLRIRRAGANWAALFCLIISLSVLQMTLCSLVRADEAAPLDLVGPPWPPYLDPQAPNQGLATQIVLAALEAGGYPDVRVRLRPWRRVLFEADQGQVSGLIGLWHSPERETRFLFSDPYLVSPIVLLLPKDARVRPLTLAELKTVRLAYRAGARFGAAFDESDALDKHPVSGTLSMARMVARGRMDAGLEDGLVLKSILKRHPDLKSSLRLMQQPLLQQPLHFGVVADHPGARQLLEGFNLGLKRIRANGRYRTILEEFSSVWDGVISVDHHQDG